MTDSYNLPADVADTPSGSDVPYLIDLAQEATKAQKLDPGHVYAFVAGGRVHQVDLDLDQYREAPRRKQGTVRVVDPQSFATYYRKHSDPDTEVYADEHGYTITAVLDAHTDEAPRWGTHRLILGLEHSAAWQAWAEYDGKLLPQVSFAELVEQRLPDIIDPPAADLLELAQTFHATSSTRFRSVNVLKSGQRQLQYVEDISATAGAEGQLVVPDTFTLALKPFTGSAAYKVTARLRYRIVDGKLNLGYKLERPEDVLTDAFDDVINAVREALDDIPILRGTPA